jgi:hypothetical protein
MRRAIVAMAVVLVSATLVWAAGRPGVVRTKAGGVYEGSVEEKENIVTVNVRGIITNIERENVTTITYGDFESRFTEDYAKLKPDDAKGRIAMGRRAFDERRYDLAEKALRDAQQVDPNNAEAAELLRLTLSQKRLESGTPGANDPGSTGQTPGTPGTTANTSPWKTLDPDQINKIKQGELSRADDKTNFRFENNVLKRYHDSDPNTGMNFTQFSRQPNYVKAQMIIRNGGELAKDVVVTSDPQSMLTFRREVMPIVLQGCATAACHGGANDSAKVFAMISPSPSVADAYTNYFVLHKYKKNVSEGVIEGVFNATFAPMIDRLTPDQSLLLQYGLPEQNADRKHPVVRGYNGIFSRGRDDPKYRTVVNWISSLDKVEPDYKIDFKLERRDPTPTTPPPATEPAPAPVEPAPK